MHNITIVEHSFIRDGFISKRSWQAICFNWGKSRDVLFAAEHAQIGRSTRGPKMPTVQNGSGIPSVQYSGPQLLSLDWAQFDSERHNWGYVGQDINIFITSLLHITSLLLHPIRIIEVIDSRADWIRDSNPLKEELRCWRGIFRRESKAHKIVQIRLFIICSFPSGSQLSSVEPAVTVWISKRQFILLS